MFNIYKYCILGWCSMNYPSVLINPALKPKPKPRTDEELE